MWHRDRKALERDLAPVQEDHAVKPAGDGRQALAGEDITGTGQAAKSGSQVQGRSTVALTHYDCLTGIETDARMQRQSGPPSLVCQARL